MTTENDVLLKKTIKEKTIPIKDENNCRDEPSKQDYQFTDFEDVYEGEKSPRPKTKLIVQNQLATKWCTCFSLWHLYNGYNILEDEKAWENRPQVECREIWKQYCYKRGYDNVWASIQQVAKFFKDTGRIEWYVTINWDISQQVARMRKSLDMWYFLSTWSANGNWTKTKKTWTYTIRTDWRFVGHAFAIVDYMDDYFWAINSYGDTRWLYNWYFKIMNTDIGKLYSKLSIIDKDDTGNFKLSKEVEKAKASIRAAQDLYHSSLKQGTYDTCHLHADALRQIYNIRDI